jgi:hypothetical protein
MREQLAWAVIDMDGRLVGWRSMMDGDDGVEIHRTYKLARGAKMANERVVRVRITQVGK